MRYYLTVLLTPLVFLAAPTVARAQNVSPITGYEIQVYRSTDPTTGPAFRTVQVTFPGAFVTCGLAPTSAVCSPTNLVNPTSVEIDDPANPALACRIRAAGFFPALPVGTGYVTTTTALSAVGASDRSNVSCPFDVVPVRPAAPTRQGVRP